MVILFPQYVIVNLYLCILASPLVLKATTVAGEAGLQPLGKGSSGFLQLVL